MEFLDSQRRLDTPTERMSKQGSNQTHTLRTQLVDGDRLTLGRTAPFRLSRFMRKVGWPGYALAVALVGIATALCEILNWHGDPANLIMIYLLAVVYAATRLGRGPAVLVSILSVVVFDFLFIPPYFVVTLRDTKYLFSLVVMLIVALVVSQLAASARQRAELAQEKVKRAEAQYCLSRDLSQSGKIDDLAAVAKHHISNVFHCPVAIFMPAPGGGQLEIVRRHETIALNSDEMAAAEKTFRTKSIVKPDQDGSPGMGLYVPLLGSHKIVGVIGLLPGSQNFSFGKEEMNLMLAFANQTAIAIERAILWESAEEANLRIERERLRNALLSSVSHDLRTPLSSITGAASSLLASFESLKTDVVRELLQSIYDEAERLNRLVGNLLDMTKLQSGVVILKKDWYSLEEVVGAAINRLEKRLVTHRITTEIPLDLPLIAMDETLIEQLLINLLDNAIKYSPSQSEIRITAQLKHQRLTVEVFNTGSEIPSGEESRIFEKFYRAGRNTTSGGVGLGLAICRGIVEAHGGKIWAEDRPGSGSSFIFFLPQEGEAPKVEMETEGARLDA